MIQRYRSGTKLVSERGSLLPPGAFGRLRSLLVDDYGSLLPCISRYALFHLLGSLLL